MEQKLKLILMAVFLLCGAALAAAALYMSYSRPIIGGSGLPTFWFSLRLVMTSPPGLAAASVGLLSGVAAAVLQLKK